MHPNKQKNLQNIIEDPKILSKLYILSQMLIYFLMGQKYMDHLGGSYPAGHSFTLI